MSSQSHRPSVNVDSIGHVSVSSRAAFDFALILNPPHFLLSSRSVFLPQSALPCSDEGVQPPCPAVNGTSLLVVVSTFGFHAFVSRTPLSDRCGWGALTIHSTRRTLWLMRTHSQSTSPFDTQNHMSRLSSYVTVVALLVWAACCASADVSPADATGPTGRYGAPGGGIIAQGSDIVAQQNGQESSPYGPMGGPAGAGGGTGREVRMGLSDPLPSQAEAQSRLSAATATVGGAAAAVAAACDCTKDTTQPCCYLKCLRTPLECAKANGVPSTNLDIIRDRLAKCDATQLLVWCASKSSCVKIGDACEGLLEEAVNLIGGLRPGEKCLASGGYSWCAAKSKCLQPWREPCATTIGGKLPGQKCYGAAGYSWCEAKSKCVRPWEEACPAPLTGGDIGGKLPGEKCLAAAGFSWCASKNKCLKRWLEACPDPLQPSAPALKPKCESLIAGYAWCDTLNACATTAECTRVSKQTIGGMLPGEKCLGAAGYSWCQAKNKCLQVWVESC